MKYGIRLVSKYTGKSVAVLGTTYDTRDEARKYFEENCCSKCNQMELVCVRDGSVWVDRETGFALNEV